MKIYIDLMTFGHRILLMIFQILAERPPNLMNNYGSLSPYHHVTDSEFAFAYPIQVNGETQIYIIE